MAYLNKKNYAYGFLKDNPLSSSSTALTLGPGEGSRFPASNFLLEIWDINNYADPSLDSSREIMLCTSRNGDSFTVARAQEGTSSNNHPVGSKVIIPITAGTFEEIQNSISASVSSINGKTGDVVLSLSDVGGTNDHTQLANIGTNTHAQIDTAMARLASTQGTNTGDQDLSGLVTKSTTVNGHALSSNVVVTSSDVGLGNVDNTSDATKNSATATLTNKRISKRTASTTSSATPTINTDNVDMYLLTGQAVDITSFTTNLSGTPTEGQLLWIAITGTAARAITWGNSFEASTVALPTTTVTTNRLDVGFVWNSVTSKWRCVASA